MKLYDALSSSIFMRFLRRANEAIVSKLFIYSLSGPCYEIHDVNPLDWVRRWVAWVRFLERWLGGRHCCLIFLNEIYRFICC